MKSEKDFKFPHKPTPSGRTASFGCSRSMIPQRDSDRILFQGYRIRRNFMELTVTRRDPLLVVSGLPAFFDYTVCPDFQRDLAASLEPAPSVLLIDLSGVEFMIFRSHIDRVNYLEKSYIDELNELVPLRHPQG